MKLAIFIFAASQTIGGGHLYRCHALAETLLASAWKVTFVVSDQAAVMLENLSDGRVDIVVHDDRTKLNTLVAERWPAGCELLIIDDYDRDRNFEASFVGWARQLLVIDDLADRKHFCDFLLDQTLGRKECDYRGLVPEHCHLMVGASYALLRPQFAAARGTALERRNRGRTIGRVLVSMGASDPGNVTLKAMQALQLADLDAEIDIVLGPMPQNADDVRQQATQLRSPCHIHWSVQDMAELMQKTDIAIGAAGSTSWERCCVGLPSIVVQTAANQASIARNLAEAGAAINCGPVHEDIVCDIAGHLRKLHENSELLSDMSEAASRICDGRGANRALEALVV